MTKPFKSIDDQYHLLLSRGLTFSDPVSAKHYLLANNYYNVINCYGKLFIDSSGNFISGASFDEIKSVHQFDKEFKSTLFKFILEAERHLKSIISHIFSQHHSNQPYAYLIATNFDTQDILKTVNLTSTLSKIIAFQKESKYPNSITHYINNHGDVPLWILSNHMSFGQILFFLKCMNKSEQNLVAKEFSTFLNENLEVQNAKLSVNNLITYLDNILEIRNTVAHDNRLLDYHCKKNTPYYAAIHTKHNVFPNNPRQDIYNVFIVLQCFLNKSQYALLHNTLRKRSRTLSAKLNTININDIFDTLGFPHDWQEIDCLSQPQ